VGVLVSPPSRAAAACSSAQAQVSGSVEAGLKVLPPWSPGELDIYHFNTGSGNSAFYILPDGTTMLLDAGDLDRRAFQRRNEALVLAPRRPCDGVTPGEAISTWIARVMPKGRAPRIDYALISHFHDDHYGAVRPGLKRSAAGGFVLTGITEVGDRIPIGTLIDRAFPDYERRLDDQQLQNPTLKNYRSFLAYEQAHGMTVERLIPGAADQIVPRFDRQKFPSFVVKNIKSSEELWTPMGIQTLFPIKGVHYASGKINENIESLAIKVSYGQFTYFAGGDNTGLVEAEEPGSRDTETALSDSVGPVDVMTLDHHGNRDAMNAHLLSVLQPRVLIQQSWVSDQPGQEVVHRLASRAIWPGARDVFATTLAPSSRPSIGAILDQTYTASGGAVLVRVDPGGTSYRVLMISDDDFSMNVIKSFGPFSAKGAAGR
jgi:hypothetical protein